MSTNPNINKILGERLKEIRTTKKITREMLAEKIDVSARFLADVETGKVGISLSTLKNICESLDISADFLLGNTSNKDDCEIYELNSIINRIDKRYIPYLTTIVSSFYDAISKNE